MLLRLGSLNSALGVEELYERAKEALANRTGTDPLLLDLSGVAFIPPAGVIALITAARVWFNETGERIQLCNIRPNVHQYLERIDLFDQCSLWLGQDCSVAPSDRLDRSRASLRLLEVLPLSSEEDQNSTDVAAAVRRARRIVGAWFDADDVAVGRLLTILAEIASNVTHSRDRGFAVIQRYQDVNSPQLGGRVTIAVGDSGIGIEQSLKTKHSARRPLAISSGAEYILHAIQ